MEVQENIGVVLRKQSSLVWLSHIKFSASLGIGDEEWYQHTPVFFASARNAEGSF